MSRLPILPRCLTHSRPHCSRLHQRLPNSSAGLSNVMSTVKGCSCTLQGSSTHCHLGRRSVKVIDCFSVVPDFMFFFIKCFTSLPPSTSIQTTEGGVWREGTENARTNFASDAFLNFLVARNYWCNHSKNVVRTARSYFVCATVNDL